MWTLIARQRSASASAACAHSAAQAVAPVVLTQHKLGNIKRQYTTIQLPRSNASPVFAVSSSPLASSFSFSSRRPNSAAAAAALIRQLQSHAIKLNAQTQQQQQEQQQQKQEEHRSNDENTGSKQQKSSGGFNPFRLLFRGLRAAFDWYAGKLDTHPIKTQSLTSGFLFAIGDITAQRYEDRLDRDNGIDTSDRPYIDLLRLAACTSFGLFLLGPCGNWWYSRLDTFTNARYAPRTFKNVGLKVFLDTAIFNPIFLVVFFTVVSLLEGLTFKDIGHKLYRDFVPSYAVDCSVWPPIQTLNFRFVPVKFQLLVVNLGCYFDDVFLSYCQHNGLPEAFVWITNEWLAFIDQEEGGAKKHAVTENPHAHHHHQTGQPAMLKSEDGKDIEKNASGEVVMLVPADAAHAHTQGHVHEMQKGDAAATKKEPLPHHHVVPKALSEIDRDLPRSHGIDIHLVQELDKDYAAVPASEEQQKKLADGKNKTHSK